VDAAALGVRRDGRAGRYRPRERSSRAQTNDACCVRRSRVVLAPVAGVKLAEAKSARPGLGKTLNPLTTVTKRIRRRGEREGNR
jgi:hypothetical protein